MIITATIKAKIKVNPDDNPDEAHEQAIEALAHICEGWIQGDMAPKIKIEYTLDDKITPEIKDRYLN